MADPHEHCVRNHATKEGHEHGHQCDWCLFQGRKAERILIVEWLLDWAPDSGWAPLARVTVEHIAELIERRAYAVPEKREHRR